ncbi:MAG TPA: DUF1080 domain-containing protein [Gemmatales bacterium]|nr:DUF1080 domain-containing protein [Gemmatales bacterium]
MLLLSLLLSPLEDFYGSIDELRLAKPEDKVDMPSVPPPAGATVLFDGKSFDNWQKKDGKAVGWKLLDGGIMEVSKTGDIVTKEKFNGHFKLHVEFRVPYMPKAKGQGRGNSGIYVQGRYEVQVLDSYGLESKIDDCAAIYSIAKPRVNACKAPTVWQTYDIEFRAPIFVDGKKKEPAVMSVWHNGILVHDKVILTKDNTPAGAGGDPSLPDPILLQDHGNPVQYRNIWLIQLDK